MTRPSTSLANIFSLGHNYNNAFLRFQGNIPFLSSIKSVRDIDEDSSKTVFESYIALNSNKNVLESLPNIHHPTLIKPVLYDVSPSGSMTFTAYHSSDNKPIIELSSSSYNFKIDASNHHDRFQGDIWFSSISWSYDERYIAYMANAKQDKNAASTHFERNSDVINTFKSNEKSKFDYKEDWGEKFDGVVSLVIVIVDTQTGAIKTLHSNDDVSGSAGDSQQIKGKDSDSGEATLGCPVFHPNTLQLVYTKWTAKPRRLGLLHCHQRLSSLYIVDVQDYLQNTNTKMNTNTNTNEESITMSTLADISINKLNPACLTPKLPIARLARFTPTGEHIIVLGREEHSLSHSSCYELFRLDSTLNQDKSGCKKWLTASAITSTKLVHVVNVPKTPHDFPGLYVDQIPSRCFIDSEHIVLNTGWYSTEAMVKVNIKTGAVVNLNSIIIQSGAYSKEELDHNNDIKLHASCSMLEATTYNPHTKSSYIVCTTSTPVTPPRLCLLQISCHSDADNSHVSASTSSDTKYIVWKSRLPTKFYSVSSKVQFNAPSSSSSTTTTHSIDPTSGVVNTNNIPIAPIAAATPTGLVDSWSNLENHIKRMKWHVIDYYAPAPSNDDTAVTMTDSDSKNTQDMSHRYECILLLPPSPANTAESSPQQPSALPLVIVPHGGPHSALTTVFLPAYVFLSLSLSAAVLFVNYRGSTNFGQFGIDSLLGKIGTNDVQDVIQCIDELTLTIPAGSAGNTNNSMNEKIQELLMNEKLTFDRNKLTVVGGNEVKSSQVVDTFRIN